MEQSRLGLRPLPWIVAAYFVVPLLAPIAAYGTMPPALRPQPIWVMVGSAIVAAALLAAELMLVTPVLLGFSRYRWRWLNGWSGCAIGVVAALIFAALLPGGIPSGHTPGTTIAIDANGAITVHAGWHGFLGNELRTALIGLAVALTFRVLAVRKVTVG